MNSFLAMLRDRETGTAEFRAASEHLAELLIREMHVRLMARLPAPERIVLVIILRSGIALLPSALRTFPGAPVGVLGMKRDERTFAPHWYYENLPPLSKNDTVVILDPMLATGGSAEAAANRLVERGAITSNLHFVGVIGATEGLARLSRLIQEDHIILAAIDAELDAHKYIVPGLGDFGDRYFGS